MARPSKQQEIGIWLKGLLSAGRRKAEDVIAAAVASGYATNPENGTRTLRRVKAELGIVSEQEGEVWYWRDPAIEQAKPASDQKLDILAHKVDELTRLSQPAVPVPTASTEWTPVGKSRVIDIRNPETQARFEAIRRAHERFEAQQAVVTSADPFALLEHAKDPDEIQQMMLLVRNHQADLTDRERGEQRFRKDPSGGGLVPDGFEPGEDVTLEMGKWDTWIDRAKERERELWKSHSVAAEL
jgi:hypothetical protein